MQLAKRSVFFSVVMGAFVLLIVSAIFVILVVFVQRSGIGATPTTPTLIPFMTAVMRTINGTSVSAEDLRNRPSPTGTQYDVAPYPGYPQYPQGQLDTIATITAANSRIGK